MTCSTGLMMFSPCIMAWRKEKKTVRTAPPPCSRALPDPRLKKNCCRTARATRAPTTAGPGQARVLRASRHRAQLQAWLLPSGPGQPWAPAPSSPCPDLTQPPAPPRAAPRPAVPGAQAAHRDGPLAQPHAHDAASPVRPRRCRQILPPSRAMPPSFRRVWKSPPHVTQSGEPYWLPGAVRRKRFAGAIGRRHRGSRRWRCRRRNGGSERPGVGPRWNRPCGSGSRRRRRCGTRCAWAAASSGERRGGARSSP